MATHKVSHGKVQTSAAWWRSKGSSWRPEAHHVASWNSPSGSQRVCMEGRRSSPRWRWSLSFSQQAEQRLLVSFFFYSIWVKNWLAGSTHTQAECSVFNKCFQPHPEPCWPNLVGHFLLKLTKSTNCLKILKNSTNICREIYKASWENENTTLKCMGCSENSTMRKTCRCLHWKGRS